MNRLLIWPFDRLSPNGGGGGCATPSASTLPPVRVEPVEAQRQGFAVSIRICLGWFMAGVALCFGLSASAHDTPVLDDSGQALGQMASPQRIVSLLPSLTEGVCALGACDRLVGVDRFSNWPAHVAGLPKVGGLEDPQIERIVALRPDVVLASPSARVIDRLRALGVRVVVLESNSRADVRRGLHVLGHLLGVSDEARRVWQRMESETAAAAARVPPGLRGQRVYFEVDASPYGAGAGSFIGETLALLGMGNIVPAALGPFPRLNPEFVVRAQPDVVMAAQRNLADMPARPGWRHLRALQQQRSCGFDNAHYELLVRPGPRMGEAAAVLADCLASLAAGGKE